MRSLLAALATLAGPPPLSRKKKKKTKCTEFYFLTNPQEVNAKTKAIQFTKQSSYREPVALIRNEK